MVANHIPINDLDLQSIGQKFGGDSTTNGSLPGPAETGEPNRKTTLLCHTRCHVFQAVTRLDRTGLHDHSRGDRGVGLGIDDDEAAGAAIAFIWVTEDRAL